MTEKIKPSEYREMSIKEIQRTINNQRKKKKKLLYGEYGGGKTPSPEEHVGTVKKNIALGKTILNEKLSNNKGESN